MVKHPQSHLGYCVNGVRQNVYLRHNHSETHKHNQRRKPKLENASRYRRWEQLHHAAQIPKRVHPGRDRKPVSDAKDPLDVRYRKLRFTGEMEDLKNASKSGKLSDALTAVYQMQMSYFACNSRAQRTLLVVRLIAAPGLENRSAIYYAAHCGHLHMVKVYLAILVLWVARRRRYESTESRSMQSWFNLLGFVRFFGQRELDLCVLNALNDGVKRAFKRSKFTLNQLESFVAKSPFEKLVIIHNELKKKKKSSERPIANVKPYATLAEKDQFEDEYICYDDDLTDDEECTGKKTEPSDVDEWEVDPEHYHLLDSLDEEKELLFRGGASDFPPLGSFEQNEQALSCGDLQPLSGAENRSNDEDDSWVESGSFESSFASVAEAEDASVAESDWTGLSNMIDASEHQADNWTVVSDIPSVQSFASTPMSYRDVLESNKNAAHSSIVDQKKKRVFQASPDDSMKSAAFDDTETMFDDQFLYEGVKCGHGGRTGLMFRGNQKHNRYSPFYEPKRRIDRKAKRTVY